MLRKLDVFLAAGVVAGSGAAASQAQAFIIQYVQRLGGHLDEARAVLTNIQTGLRYKLMNETVRVELEREAQARVNELAGAYNAIAGSNIFAQPISLFRNADPTIVAGTWRDFVPVLPLGADNITYVIVGMVLGYIVYEIVKVPVVLLFREPERRRFKRKG